MTLNEFECCNLLLIWSAVNEHRLEKLGRESNKARFAVSSAGSRLMEAIFAAHMCEFARWVSQTMTPRTTWKKVQWL